VGDVGHMVLRDRRALSGGGVAIVVVAIDGHSGAIAGAPQLITKGLVLGASDAESIEEAKIRLGKVLKRLAREGVTDAAVIRKSLRDSLSQYIWETARCRPMIVPVVLEV